MNIENTLSKLMSILGLAASREIKMDKLEELLGGRVSTIIRIERTSFTEAVFARRLGAAVSYTTVRLPQESLLQLIRDVSRLNPDVKVTSRNRTAVQLKRVDVSALIEAPQVWK